jgi:protein-S-isoprenylcysteine O-methyltransferase Ste14
MLHLSFFLITHNALILVSGMVMSIYVNERRIKVEEGLLSERFGPEYEAYRLRVGKYFLRLRRRA